MTVSTHPKSRAPRTPGKRIYGSTRCCVGTLLPSGVLVRQCDPDHLLRKPPAIATDALGLAQAAKLGAEIVRVEVSDGRIFSAPLSLILESGFRVSRGWGEQLALPLAKWTLTLAAGGAR